MGILLKSLHDKFAHSSYCAAIFITLLISALGAFLLPISPVNDGYNMALALRELHHDGGLYYGFNLPYFSFFANNKVALVVYWGVVSLVRDVELGIRIVNFICIFSSSFFFSLSIGIVFGDKWRSFGLLFCLTLFPFIILTSPYVYPIGIALSSIAFYLGISKRLVFKPLFFVALGLLFLIRPTASVFIFVFFTFDFLRHLVNKDKRRCAYALLIIILLFASAYFTRWGVGTVFYRSGFHPYPNLTSGATNWTLDIGTRFDRQNTGVAVYAPFSLPEAMKDDDIAIMQNRLFAYFVANNPDYFQTVVELNREIRTAIFNRAREDLFSNPFNIFRFYAWKSTRLFGPSNCTFYFYALNITLPSFEWQAHRNLEQDSKIHIFALIMFLFMSFVYVIIRLLKRRKYDNKMMLALSNLISCVLVVFIMLTLTEVGQRGLLDIYIPAILTACASYIFVLDSLKIWTHHNPCKTLTTDANASNILVRNPVLSIRRVVCSLRSKIALGGALKIFGLLIALVVYSSNNIAVFRNMEVDVTREHGYLRIEFLLANYPSSTYYFIHDGHVIYLTQRTVLEVAEGTTIFFHTPNQAIRIITSDGWRQ